MQIYISFFFSVIFSRLFLRYWHSSCFFFFFFWSSIGMAFVSSRLLSVLSFIFVSIVFSSTLFVCVSISSAKDMSRPANHSIDFRRSVCLSLDGDSKINFNSVFVCLVDWQRCTQVVIRVYERERERVRKWKCVGASEMERVRMTLGKWGVIRMWSSMDVKELVVCRDVEWRDF